MKNPMKKLCVLASLIIAAITLGGCHYGSYSYGFGYDSGPAFCDPGPPRHHHHHGHHHRHGHHH